MRSSPTTGGVPIEDWAVRAFAEWKVGRKGLDNGVALFVFAEDRALRIEVGYGLEDRVPDALASTANYLRRAKWRTGAPWMIEVKVPRGYAGPQGRRNRAPLASWAARGIVRAPRLARCGVSI